MAATLSLRAGYPRTRIGAAGFSTPTEKKIGDAIVALPAQWRGLAQYRVALDTLTARANAVAAPDEVFQAIQNARDNYATARDGLRELYTAAIEALQAAESEGTLTPQEAQQLRRHLTTQTDGLGEITLATLALVALVCAAVVAVMTYGIPETIDAIGRSLDKLRATIAATGPVIANLERIYVPRETVPVPVFNANGSIARNPDGSPVMIPAGGIARNPGGAPAGPAAAGGAASSAATAAASTAALGIAAAVIVALLIFGSKK